MSTSVIRLAVAVVCLDCEVVFQVPAQRCPMCGSESWWPLARFLNRDPSPATIISAGV